MRHHPFGPRHLVFVLAMIAAGTNASAGADPTSTVTFIAKVPASMNPVDSIVAYFRETDGESVRVLSVNPPTARVITGVLPQRNASLVVTNIRLLPGQTLSVTFSAQHQLPGMICFNGGWWLNQTKSTKLLRADENIPANCPVPLANGRRRASQGTFPFAFDLSMSCTFVDGKTSATLGGGGPIPGGYNDFLIKYVSGTGSLPSGQSMYVEVSTGFSEITVPAIRVYTNGAPSPSPSPTDQFVFAAPVFVYTKFSNPALSGVCIRSSSSGQAVFNVILDGIVNNGTIQ